MKGRGAFFLRWLTRSLSRTLSSGAVATASLATSAAVVFCLAAVSSGVEVQLGRELRAYGANLVIVPRQTPLRFGLGAYDLGGVDDGRLLSAAALSALPRDAVGVVAPGLTLRASARGAEIGATGWALDALQVLQPAWKVTPRWPASAGEAMAGVRAAARLALTPGVELDLASSGRTARVLVIAIVETGGPEDDDLFLPLSVAQDLAAKPDAASLALVRANGLRVDETTRRIEAALPGAQARTVQQVAAAEVALLGTIRRLLLLVAAALAAATAFTVTGTMSVLLLARRREVGLCLALGAGAAQVRALLLAEAAVAGLAGGVGGCVAGAAVAEAVAVTVFGRAIAITAAPALLAVSTAVVIAVSASLWPVARALAADPCDTLRAS